jgi:hypothetical protein
MCTNENLIHGYDSNTGTEATVVFNMANTQTGVNREAGLYAFSARVTPNLY